MKHEWTIDAKKTADHWLELTGGDARSPEDVWYSVVAKWDGCVDFRRYYNDPNGSPNRKADDSDYIHICDIDEMIADLQEIKRMAQEHFAGKSGEGYWPTDE